MIASAQTGAYPRFTGYLAADLCVLQSISFRVPKRNELYINKNGQVQRCKKTNHSKRAQPRIIVKESWL